MWHRFLLIAARIISLLAAIILSIESYLTTQGKSLCSTAACEIVSHYLVINEAILIALGASFFWILSLFFFLAHRYSCQIGFTPYLLLIIALSIDGNLIGFQLFTIQQKCLLCLSVAVSLLVTSLLYCLAKKAYLLLFCCLFTWICSFATNSIIKMPVPLGTATKMVFFQKKPEQNAKTVQIKNTLIFSMECPHCSEIINVLSTKDINNDIWQFASIDSDKTSLMKLSKFLQQAKKTNENPFKILKKLKEDPLQNFEISTLIKESTKYTLDFLSNLDISAIPVLIIDNSQDRKQIFIGTPDILNALSKSQQDKTL